MLFRILIAKFPGKGLPGQSLWVLPGELDEPFDVGINDSMASWAEIWMRIHAQRMAFEGIQDHHHGLRLPSPFALVVRVCGAEDLKTNIT